MLITKSIKKMLHIIFKEPTISNESMDSYTKRTLFIGALFLMFVSGILTALNIYKQYMFMAGTTTVLIVGFAIAAILAWLEKSKPSKIIMAIMCATIFSGYAITGQNDGFAILWILLVPLISMLLLDLKIGFLLSAYFQLFLFVLFYSPVLDMVKASFNPNYTDTFVMRFPVLYFASFGAITFLMCQRKQLANQTQVQAYTDGLTGLYNRHYCVEKSVTFDDVGKNPNISAVVIDINRLKYVNDNIGHEAGDEMIKATAELMLQVFTDEDCFRTGGDEFLVVSNSEDIVEKIKKLEARVELWHGEYVNSLALSIGYARRKEHRDMIFNDLYKLADQEMYKSKAKYYQETGINRRK